MLRAVPVALDFQHDRFADVFLMVSYALEEGGNYVPQTKTQLHE